MNARRAFGLALVVVAAMVLNAASPAHAGNKKVMSIRAAKVLAERGLVESIYGLKVRASEVVKDMTAATFAGSTETKTEAQIRGVRFDEAVYDAKKDVAKVTASVSLPSITNINGDVVDLKGKVFRRIAFATSTPESAGALKALRAAEVDAYKQLAKQLVGFTLESRTKVENFILSSDVVKTKVMASLFLAEVVEYGWSDNGDAYVKMALNLSDFGELVGEKVAGDAATVTVEGIGAQDDDFGEAKKQRTLKEKKR